MTPVSHPLSGTNVLVYVVMLLLISPVKTGLYTTLMITRLHSLKPGSHVSITISIRTKQKVKQRNELKQGT